jgi:hypothetical protein
VMTRILSLAVGAQMIVNEKFGHNFS